MPNGRPTDLYILFFRCRARQPQRGEIRQPRASEAKPWVRDKIERKAPRGRDSSIPDIALVEFDFVTLQQYPELVLIGHLAMVLLLICDTRTHLADVGLADRKRAVSRLPVK